MGQLEVEGWDGLGAMRPGTYCCVCRDWVLLGLAWRCMPDAGVVAADAYWPEGLPASDDLQWAFALAVSLGACDSCMITVA